MDRFALEAFLYTSDCGEDGYLFNSSSSSSDSEDDEVECTCDDQTQTPPGKKPKLELVTIEDAPDAQPENSQKFDRFYEFVELNELKKEQKWEGFAEIEVPFLNAYDFKNSFRVNRTTCTKVIEMLYPSFKTTHRGGRERINAEKATYMFLWYLGNKETFKQMADRFKNTMSAVHGVIKIATSALSLKLSAQIIWPSDAEYSNISQLFEEAGNMKGCLGILGISYIKIGIKKDNEIYMSEYDYPSVILQGVITVNGKFLDIFIGEGSNNPEQLLQKSQLFIEAENNLLGDYYLLGAGNYSDRKWLVQPYTGFLTMEQTLFNTYHKTMVNIFTESIGFLKGRFQRLQNMENRDPSLAIHSIESACMVHNLAIDCEDEHLDFFDTDTAETDVDGVKVKNTVLEGNNSDRRERVLDGLINQSTEFEV